MPTPLNSELRLDEIVHPSTDGTGMLFEPFLDEFLLAALGIGAGVDSVDKKSPNALEEYYSRRKAVQELIDPADLGEEC